MSDTPQHRPADPFPATGDPRPDASAPVAQFGRYRFRRELARVAAELRAVEAVGQAPFARLPGLDPTDRARAAVYDATGWCSCRAPARHLRLVS